MLSDNLSVKTAAYIYMDWLHSLNLQINAKPDKPLSSFYKNSQPSSN